jgi:hypothetical protein
MNLAREGSNAFRSAGASGGTRHVNNKEYA